MSQTQKSYGKGSTCPPLQPGTLRLYSMRFCPYAQRTRMVLEHKKIPYEIININLKEKPDWFLKKNPFGLVPVLEKDDKIVYESVVCDDYLEELYPRNRLVPVDPYQKARDAILILISSQFTTLWYKVLRSQGQHKDAGPELMKVVQGYEEELGQRGHFFGGPQPSMLDFTLWPWFERAEMLNLLAGEFGITAERFPKLEAWQKRMMQLPAVKATMFDTESHLHFGKSFATGYPDYDYGL